MCLNGFLSQAVSLFYCSLSWQWYIFSIFYSIMVKRKKLWEHIFFYSCLEWRANYLWLWIQTCYLSRFDYSTFVVLFLTSYFIVSNWWPIRKWNKSYFFPLVNFGSSWAAGTKLLLSGLDMTLFTTLHTCDVSHPDLAVD